MDSKSTLSNRKVLATDLDGTLIPLNGNPQNQADLKVLKAALRSEQTSLVYVTGRHLESALDAMRQHHLPEPDWIICDVGTSLYEHRMEQTQIVEAYHQHQQEIVADSPLATIKVGLEQVDGLRLQEPVKQGRFKLSYYTDAARLQDRVQAIGEVLRALDASWEVTASVDPFNGDGLIDLLPRGISKSAALRWWVQHTELHADEIVFAGDSGNDLTALTAGYRAILVGNADRQLAHRVQQQHREKGWQTRLYLADGEATSGVLQGCRHYGLFASSDRPQSAGTSAPAG